MSEGRHELEQAIAVWEKRHAEAVRLKREAEVVMPFLRAAVEELDSFRSGTAESAPAAPVVESTPEPAAPSPFDGNLPTANPFGEAAVADETVDELVAEAVEQDDSAEEPVADFPGFQPRAISALMDEEEDDEAAVG